jgi:LPS sulfotransferase NodH
MSTPEAVAQGLFRCWFAREAVVASPESIARVVDPNAVVLVAAMPKSGSSLLSKALARALGRPNISSTYAFDGNETELYLPAVARDCLLRKGVCKLHIRATTPNLELCRAFRLTPVVLVRDLLDAVVSARDHQVRDVATGVDTSDWGRWYTEADEATQYDLIIDLEVPWLLRFVASWARAARNGSVPTHWVHYRDLAADPVSVLQAVIDALGLEASVPSIDDALSSLTPDETRFNKGRGGRGRQLLTAEQQGRIRRMASYFPDVDFESLGVLAPDESVGSPSNRDHALRA